ncbi:hypothetical protein [Mucilaginibacter sp. HD30]
MAPKKKWLWIVAALFVITGTLISGWYFFKKDLANANSKIAKPLLTDQLKKMLHNASDGLYQMKYNSFNLNIDSGKGLITNLKLIADTAVYGRLITQNNAPNNVLSVKIDSLIIKKFGFIKTDSGRRFNIAAIIVKHPVIVCSNKRRAYNDTVRAGSSLIKGLIKDVLKICLVQQVTVNNMTLTYINKNESSTKQTVLRGWNMNLTDISLANFGGNKDSGDEGKQAALKIKGVSIATPDSLYRLTVTDMRLMPEQRSMYIKRFVLKPRLNKVAFYRQSGFNRDRLHFVYNDMWMKNIDLDRLLRRQQLHVGAMTAASSWTEVYNNYHWPRRVRPERNIVHPQQRLQLLAFDVTIDTIKMHSGYFRYAIAAQKSKRTANLYMTNIESSIYHVTNNAMEKKRNPYLVVRSYSRMMGEGKTRVKYIFNLTSKNGAFTSFIHMGPMDAKAANPLSAPLGLMAVKSGTINQMDMYVSATNKTAKGNIDLYYKDLKINLLKRDEKDNTLKKRGFLSLVANMTMPNDNPKGNGEFRKGPINVIRDPRMSFFGLMWKCTQDGMSSAVTGIDQKKDKPDENAVIKVIEKVLKPNQDKKQLKKDVD